MQVVISDCAVLYGAADGNGKSAPHLPTVLGGGLSIRTLIPASPASFSDWLALSTFRILISRDRRTTCAQQIIASEAEYRCVKKSLGGLRLVNGM